MFTEVTGLLGALKALRETAKALYDMNVSIEVQGKVIQLQNLITQVQEEAFRSREAHLSAVDEVRELKAEISRLKDWNLQKMRYQLFSPWNGATVYALKRESAGGEPPHWICPVCYEAGRRNLLQFKSRGAGMINPVYTCSACDFQVQSEMRVAQPFHFPDE